MNSIQALFNALIHHQNLSKQEMLSFLKPCLNGELSDAQIAVFLALMQQKGIDEHELWYAANYLRTKANHIDLGSDILDIVGTGGDGISTFNVSTAVSFVVAASGQKVCKHGNRSVSSTSGSADLLEAAGFLLNMSHEALQKSLKECGLAFLFAPNHHKTLAYAKKAREILGVRSFFNLLGPLLNPASADKMLVGVYHSSYCQPMANVLNKLNCKRAMVVHADDGLDELSICAKTHAIMLIDGKSTSLTIDPRDHNMFYSNLNDIKVNNPKESLAMIQSVLYGKQGAARDMVLINAAAALMVSEKVDSIADGIKLAASLIDNAKALQTFELSRQLSNQGTP